MNLKIEANAERELPAPSNVFSSQDDSAFSIAGNMKY